MPNHPARLSLVVDNSGKMSASVSGTPSSSALRSKGQRWRCGMPRSGQFSTVEYFTPKSSETRLSEPNRDSVSRGSNIEGSLSQFGMSVNPDLRHLGVPCTSESGLHPKKRGRTILAMPAAKKAKPSKNTPKAPKSTAPRGGKIYGDRLITIRKALGYDSKDGRPKFAEALGINKQTYANYERGRGEMGYAEMGRLAEKGGSIAYLVLGIPPATSAVLKKGA